MDVKEATKVLEQGVTEIFTSGRFQEYLDVMSKFHDYSARNCMLIMMQCPTATRVASYRNWQKMKRQVRKGEKSIRILAPCPHKVTIRETNKDTGEVKDHEQEWMTFRAVSVFDISQTDGENLPEIVNNVEGNVENFKTLCKAVEKAATCNVEYDAEIDGECNGYYRCSENVIRIKGGMSEVQTFKTLVHKTAHSILHCKDGEQTKASQDRREVQAEGVAYVVCKSLGIDTSGYSFGYVAGWGNDLKVICGELETIRTTAKKILEKIAA